MKWLIVLIVILAAFALVALRYRRQLLAGWQLYKMYRQMRAAGKPPTEKRINRGAKTAREETASERLVRCSRCNKWVSPTEAVKLRGKNNYCSTACLEKAVKIASLVD